MTPTIFHRLHLLLTVTLRTIAVICLGTLAYIGAGEIGGRLTYNANFVQTPGGIDLYVVSNGIHTDIVIPVVSAEIDWRTEFDPTTFDPPTATDQVDMIAFGWGEKGLYENVPTWDDLTFGVTAHALLWPTQSAMHVTYYRSPPAPSPLVRHMKISPEQHRTLVQIIINSFTRDGAGRPISLDCCWYPGIVDNFYYSPRSYHLLRTCNNWTNQALKDTGIRTALWTPFHDKLLAQLDGIPPLPPASDS